MKQNLFKTGLLGLALLLVLGGAGTVAIYRQASTRPKEPIKLSGKFANGQEYQVAVQRVRVTQESGFLPWVWLQKRGHFAGVDVVTDLAVTLAGKKVEIPASAYRDIRNPDKDQVSVIQVGTLVVLTLAGKDQGAFYQARYAIWPPNILFRRDLSRGGKIESLAFQVPWDKSQAQAVKLSPAGGVVKIGEWKITGPGAPQ